MAPEGPLANVQLSAAPGAPRLMVPTLRAFDAWYAIAEAGARCTYWSGLLAADICDVGGIPDVERRAALRQLAAQLRQDSWTGRVRLYQKRTSFGTFFYIAEKPRAPQPTDAPIARLPAGADAGSSAGRSSNGRK